MRVMGALTPEERLESRMVELIELRSKIDGEVRRIKAALRRTNPNGRPPGPRPPCNTERGYQRHYREGESCDTCKAAHRRHQKAWAAARKLAESPVETGESGVAQDTLGAYINEPPAAYLEVRSQGLSSTIEESTNG